MSDDIFRLARSKKNAFFENGEVRLLVTIDSGGLVGFADIGNAIADVNVRLADAVRVALLNAGYTRAVLVLDAGESRDLAAENPPPTGPEGA